MNGRRYYWLARTALNVPSFEGPSPTSGENSASPVIKSGLSNFPLSVKVPASRPTLPIRNSTGPENVTDFPSPGVHFASEDLAPAQTLDCGSVTVRVPFPSFCASKRTKRCGSVAKVISTFQLPVTFGESAPARTKENVFTAITRIIARAVFTFFSTSNLICAQIHWVLRLQFTQSTAGTHELFGEFPVTPFATARAGHGHCSPIIIYDRGGGVGRGLGVGRVLGVGLGLGVEVGVGVGVAVGVAVAVAVAVAVGVGVGVGVPPPPIQVPGSQQ